MYKKLTKHGNSLAVVIDKPILKMLKIDKNSAINLRIEGNELIIKKGRQKKAKSANRRSVDQIANKILKKYSPLFEKLAKK